MNIFIVLGESEAKGRTKSSRMVVGSLGEYTHRLKIFVKYTVAKG